MGVFLFDKIDGIKLPGITSPFTEKTIGLRYIFDTSFSVDDLNNQSIKYTFETNRTIDNSNFTFQTKLSTMDLVDLKNNNIDLIKIPLITVLSF